MRILLISANTETINMPVLPLGMALVAASTEKAGHDLMLLNLLGSDDPPLALQEAIDKHNPDVIGISVRNVDDQSMNKPQFMLGPVKALVNRCKRISGAPVILGGAGFSIFPMETLAYTEADYGIQGEGEDTFPLFLQYLELRRSPASIPGVYVRGSSKGNAPCFSTNLDRLPLPCPERHLQIPSSLKKDELWLPFQTRRGCPMGCSYCSTPVIEGTAIRSRGIDTVVENMGRFTERGINRFFFVDNTFNVPASYAGQLCDAITASGLRIKWRAIVYPWKIDGKLAGKMANSGCEEVSLGFESGSVSVLKKLNKQYTREDVKMISRIFNDCGIRQMGFLLLGGPGETRETVLESLGFAETLPIDALKLTTGIRIYPGTPLAKTAVEENIIPSSGNLLQPMFYLRPELAAWLPQYIKKWAEQRPHCICN